jgi:salicylate hydroxylase
VAIVGGGIGGLTLALALTQREIPFTVFEQAPSFVEEGAGLQLSPNATRLLRRLGLGEALREVAFRPRALEMLDGLTGAPIFRVRLADELERRFGAPLLTVRRQALHAALLHAISADAVVMGAAVTSVRPAPRGITVCFEDRSAYAAGVVIGADGIRSAVRRHLLSDGGPSPSGKAVYRGVIPPERRPSAAIAEAICVWTGPGRHCVAYPVTASGAVSFAAVVPATGRAGEARSSSHARHELLVAYQGWARELHELFAAAGTLRRWELFDLPTADRSASGRLALLGDAAHAMLPFLAQGANCAIEDAFTLAACLAGSWPDEVEASLSRYESLRLPRAARLQAEARSRAGRRAGSAPRAAFDATSSYLSSQAWMFGYDAQRAVAEAGEVAVA